MTTRNYHRRNIRRIEAQIDALVLIHAETANQFDRLTAELERERFALLMLDAPAIGGTVDVRFYALEAV